MWFNNKLIPNLEQDSVIVIDNASYHSRQSVKISNGSSKKSDIIQYLYDIDLYFEENYTKQQLLKVVRSKQVEKHMFVMKLLLDMDILFFVCRHTIVFCELSQREY